MRKFVPYFIAAVAFILGFGAGGYFFQQIGASLELRMSGINASDEAMILVAALRSVRAGDTNEATERLEVRLDDKLIELAHIYRSSSQPKTKRYPLEAIERARVYRTEYPHIAKAREGAVASALAVADKERNR